MGRVRDGERHAVAIIALVGTLGLLAGGCSTFSRALHVDAASLSAPATPPVAADASPATTNFAAGTPSLTASAPAADVETAPAGTSDVVVVSDASGEPGAGGALAVSALAQDESALAADTEEFYDPWESFNETMFNVNRNLDKYVLKPAANVYRHVMPEPFQVLVDNGFSNIRWVPRFVNSVLQGKFEGAGRELGRFLINSTAGIGGLFDPAKDYWHIQPSKEDFGQTLGVWGVGPGPYLILPLLPPMTVRDGIGMGVDGVMDPLSYYIGFFPERIAMKAGDTLNDRALNYDLFQGVEETTIDLYSSVRHFYLKRREQQIKE